jgi:DNA repair protein RadC
VIVFHNHPSGDPSPSSEDLAFTSTLADVGAALGVDILDHIIVAPSSFVSFKQRGLL